MRQQQNRDSIDYILFNSFIRFEFAILTVTGLFFFSWKELKNALLGLPAKLKGIIKSYELGTDLKLGGGQSGPPGSGNRTVCWSATFSNAQDYETYNLSEEHVHVVSTFIKPYIVPGSRAAIQYNI